MNKANRSIRRARVFHTHSMKTKQQPIRGEAIKKTLAHDAGAMARCSYCGRYSDDPDSLKQKFMCECGTDIGWSGSFMPPMRTSRWSDL